MADTKKLADAFKAYGEQFEPYEDVFWATYVSDNNDGTHEVDMDNTDGTQGPRRTVLGSVSAWAGVRVRVGVDRMRYGPQEYVILGVDKTGYGTGYGGTSPPPSMLELHGERHGDQAIDQIPNLHTLQIWPVRGQPATGLTVDVLEGLYFAGGGYEYNPSTQNIDISAHEPAVVGRAVFVTLSIDDAQSITQTAGTEQINPQASDIALAPVGEYPICAVRIENGQTQIQQTDVRTDLRFLPGSYASGGTALWSNVLIVAKAGGQYGTVQQGINGASGSHQTVWILPGAYSENITIDHTDVVLRGLGAKSRSGETGSRIAGSDEVGPMVTVAANCVVIGLLINKEMTGGAGEFVGVDASDTTYNTQIADCRITCGDGGFSRDIATVQIAGRADGKESSLNRCVVEAESVTSAKAVELFGNNVIIEQCEIIGNIATDTATDLTLDDVYVEGNVTGAAGGTLTIRGNCSIVGTVSGWDSVDYAATHGMVNRIACVNNEVVCHDNEVVLI